MSGAFLEAESGEKGCVQAILKSLEMVMNPRMSASHGEQLNSMVSCHRQTPNEWKCL